MGAYAGPPIEAHSPAHRMLRAMTRPHADAATERDLPLLRRWLLASVFDAAFRDPAAEERLFFAIPGALCVPCRQLYVDQQLIGILGLTEARCTFAIESDRILRAGAALVLSRRLAGSAPAPRRAGARRARPRSPAPAPWRSS